MPQNELYASQVHQAYASASTASAAAIAAAGVLICVLWDSVSPTRLIIWLSCYVGLQAARLVSIARFTKASPQGSAVLFWGRLHTLWVGLGGLSWGSVSLFLFPYGSPADQIVLVFFSLGVSCAATVLYSATFCFPLTIVGSLVPLAGCLFFLNEELPITLGAVILLFAVLMMMTGRNVHRINAQSLSLILEKNKLINSLCNEKPRSEETNERLRAEIAERKRVEGALQETHEVLERRVNERTEQLAGVNEELCVSEERFRRLYEETKRGQDLYRSLISASPDAIVIYEAAGNVEYVSPSFTQTFGWTLDEVKGGQIPFHPDTEQDTAVLKSRNSIGRGTSYSGYETKRRTRDGRLLDVSVSAAHFFDHEGGLAGTLVILSDITLRKQAEESLRYAHQRLETRVQERTQELVLANEQLRREMAERRRAEEAVRQSEVRYRHLVDHAPVGFAVHAEGKGVFINRAGAMILGLEPEQVIGRPVLEFVHPDMREAARRGIELMLTEGRTSRLLEQKWLRADGSVATVQIAAAKIVYEDKPAVQVIFTDRTELKEAEEALQLEKERFEALFEQAPFGMVVIGKEGMFHHFNPAFRKMFGYDPEDIPSGKQWIEAAYPDPSYRREVVADWIAYVNSTEEHFSAARAFVVQCKDGSRKAVRFRCVRLGSGNYLMTCEDITDLNRAIAELNRAAEALKDSERRYRQLVDNANDFISVVDADGIFRLVNPVALRITGYAEEEIIGKHYLEHVHPDYRAEAERFFGIQFVKRTPDTYYECPIVTKEGETRWLGQSAQLVFEGEEVVGFQSIARDITARKNAEERLKRSEERFRGLYAQSKRREELYQSLLHSSADAVVIYDMEGGAQYVSPSFERIFGWTLAEVEGKQIDYVPSGERERTMEIIWGLKTEGSSCSDFQTRRFTKSGRLVDVSISASVYRDHEGSPAGILTILTDITERKRAEYALAESEKRYRLLVETARDIIWTIDKHLRYTYVSPAIRDVLGYSVEEVLGAEALSFVAPSSRERLLAGFAQEMELEQEGADRPKAARVEEVEQLHHDGSLRWIEITATYLRDQENAQAGFLGISRDVTARKLAEQELARALTVSTQLQAQAEAANRAKSDFLANMSHELRTPLNAIIGLSEILMDQNYGPLNKEQLEYVEIVVNSGHHLLNLINDILDLAKVETGRMDLQLDDVNIGQLLRNSIVMVKEKAFKHGLALNLSLSDELADRDIVGDEVKLKRILYNLLSNAVKFTLAGGTITLSADRNGDELVMRVADTGMGIRPRDQERIFAPFEQVDSSYSRRQEGTGLGLSLTRRLVELHDGRITVKSDGEGKGSTFTVVVPFQEHLPLIRQQPEGPY